MNIKYFMVLMVKLFTMSFSLIFITLMYDKNHSHEQFFLKLLYSLAELTTL